MSKIIKTSIFTVLVFSLALAACGPIGTEQLPGPSTEEASPIGPSDIENSAKAIRLDPAIDETDFALSVSQYVYEGLIYMDGSQIVPVLATEWSVSENGLEYTFILRQGVSFHDGTSFNADAVIANFDRWFDTENPLHGSATYVGWQEYFLAFKGGIDEDRRPVSFYDGVEKVNDFTVLFHLNRAEANFISILALPYFAFASLSMLTSSGADYGSSAETVAGTGPYRVERWTDISITLIPNASYWGEAPKDTLEFQFE